MGSPLLNEQQKSGQRMWLRNTERSKNAVWQILEAR